MSNYHPLQGFAAAVVMGATPGGVKDEADSSNRYLGRHVCTAADPYDPRKHGTHAAHPDARDVGTCADGCCDRYERPNCGRKFTVENPA